MERASPPPVCTADVILLDRLIWWYAKEVADYKKKRPMLEMSLFR